MTARIVLLALLAVLLMMMPAAARADQTTGVGRLPAGSGVLSLLDTAAPFVIADRLDTGGLNLGTMPRVAGEAASWTQTTVAVGEFESPRAPGRFNQMVLPPATAPEALSVAPEMAP